jgi:hypothetical protein
MRVTVRSVEPRTMDVPSMGTPVTASTTVKVFAPVFVSSSCRPSSPAMVALTWPVAICTTTSSLVFQPWALSTVSWTGLPVFKPVMTRVPKLSTTIPAPARKRRWFAVSSRLYGWLSSKSKARITALAPLRVGPTSRAPGRREAEPSSSGRMLRQTFMPER